MLNFLKRLAGGATKQLNSALYGNKDFLEAAIAASALVAAADGNIDQAEITETVSLLENHKVLGQAFPKSEISTVANRMFQQAKTGSGRQQLARELDDLKGKPNGAQMAEDVYYIACDVAAQGGTDANEEATLMKIADRLGVNPDPSW